MKTEWICRKQTEQRIVVFASIIGIVLMAATSAHADVFISDGVCHKLSSKTIQQEINLTTTQLGTAYHTDKPFYNEKYGVTMTLFRIDTSNNPIFGALIDGTLKQCNIATKGIAPLILAMIEGYNANTQESTDKVDDSNKETDNNEIIKGFTTINVGDSALTLQSNDVTYVKDGFILQYLNIYKKPIMVNGVYYKFHGSSFLIDCNKNTASAFEESDGDKAGNQYNKTISPYSPVSFPKGSNFDVAAKKFCK